MILKQYYLGCLSQASYMIGDEESGRAAVVDPRRDVSEYLEDARELGLEIQAVFLTHFHADFVAGHLELAGQTNAKIHLGRRADADFDFVPMADGDVLSLGRVSLEVMETPGHTPESICIVVREDGGREDGGRGGRPRAVLTGDTMFIGDVGRPDLVGSSSASAADYAGDLFDSLGRLIGLPDDTLVYPGHGAGSLCGKNLGSDSFSTIGEQRKTNGALQPMSREDFIRLVTTDLPEVPEYFHLAAMANRQQRTTLDEVLEHLVVPLSLEGSLQILREGGTILDARDADAYARRHLVGSIHIGLTGTYAIWAGTLLDPNRPIVLVTDQGQEREAALRLGRIGFDRIAGYLEGGAEAFADRPDLVDSYVRLAPDDVARMLDRTDPPLLLDVRTNREREEARIRDSLHIPLNRLQDRIAEIPRGRSLVVYCRSGYRSAIAASLLRRGGRRDVTDLAGGIAACEEVSSLREA